jgi:hypothetical protein
MRHFTWFWGRNNYPQQSPPNCAGCPSPNPSPPGQLARGGRAPGGAGWAPAGGRPRRLAGEELVDRAEEEGVASITVSMRSHPLRHVLTQRLGHAA